MFEVIETVRAEVGNDIAVGVRLPNEDYVPGGLTGLSYVPNQTSEPGTSANQQARFTQRHTATEAVTENV